MLRWRLWWPPGIALTLSFLFIEGQKILKGLAPLRRDREENQVHILEQNFELFNKVSHIHTPKVHIKAY